MVEFAGGGHAEFGLGYRLSIDKQSEFARELVKKLAPKIGETLREKQFSNPVKRKKRKTLWPSGCESKSLRKSWTRTTPLTCANS